MKENPIIDSLVKEKRRHTVARNLNLSIESGNWFSKPAKANGGLGVPYSPATTTQNLNLTLSTSSTEYNMLFVLFCFFVLDPQKKRTKIYCKNVLSFQKEENYTTTLLVQYQEGLRMFLQQKIILKK